MPRCSLLPPPQEAYRCCRLRHAAQPRPPGRRRAPAAVRLRCRQPRHCRHRPCQPRRASLMPHRRGDGGGAQQRAAQQHLRPAAAVSTHRRPRQRRSHPLPHSRRALPVLLRPPRARRRRHRARRAASPCSCAAPAAQLAPPPPRPAAPALLRPQPQWPWQLQPLGCRRPWPCRFCVRPAALVSLRDLAMLPSAAQPWRYRMLMHPLVH